MTSKTSPTRGLGNKIDLGVAGLAAVAAGFLAYAMPDHLFASLVAATHVADIIPAATPPLGEKARLGVIAAGAFLVLLVVWSLLRALEGKPKTVAVRRVAALDEDMPRIRRADAHPDAPARRPLFAGADLGEPDEHGETLAPSVFARTAEPAQVTETEPQRSPVDPVRDSDDVAANPRSPTVFESPIQAPAEPRPPVVERSAKDSIGSLMQRLERGLSERAEPVGQPDLPPAPQPHVEASNDSDAILSSEGVRHRLRNAISELNQVANRN